MNTNKRHPHPPSHTKSAKIGGQNLKESDKAATESGAILIATHPYCVDKDINAP